MSCMTMLSQIFCIISDLHGVPWTTLVNLLLSLLENSLEQGGIPHSNTWIRNYYLNPRSENYSQNTRKSTGS